MAQIQDAGLMIGIKAGTSAIEKFAADAVKHMKKEVALGVRDSLVLIEKRHKEKETNKGGDARAVAKKWTSRTGELRKSFHRDWKPGQLVGAYGSDQVRALVIEKGTEATGGPIKPKGTYLAIPTKNAPKKVWPRYVDNLFFIKSKKGNPLLVKSTGKDSFMVMYILKKEVELKPRPALDRAIKATEKPRHDRMMKAVDRALGETNA